MKSLLKTEFVVVGAGPVGLAASLFLQKYRIPHVVLQQHPSLSVSPASGWISSRTKEVFTEFPGLDKLIQAEQEDISRYDHLLHSQRLLGEELGRQNHLFEVERLRSYTSQNPSFLSQRRLCELMLKFVNPDSIQFGTKVQSLKSDSGTIVLETKKKGRSLTVSSRYVLACDSINSIAKTGNHINLENLSMGLQLLSIEFTSKRLAGLLERFKQQAILHFLYNQMFRAVLLPITHSEGRFVLHVPYHEKIIDEYTPAEVIQACVEQEFVSQLNDLTVVDTHDWKITGELAERFRDGNIFVAGDAAHSFPSLTGMGMNTGVQDVHNLLHKINTLRCNPRMQRDAVMTALDSYDTQRRHTANQLMQFAKHSYDYYRQIFSYLELRQELTGKNNVLQKLPFGKEAVEVLKTAMKYQPGIKPTPPEKILPFPLIEEFKFQRLSKHRVKITEEHNANTQLCYFLSSKHKQQEFDELAGVQDECIAIMELPGQKLVRSDGVLLH